MALITKVTGVKSVLRNLRAVDLASRSRVGIGLKKAGLHIQRKAQQLTPVKEGLLRNSAFTRAFGSGDKTQVYVGFTKKYAVFVHEVPARHKGKTRDKFLEIPLKEEQGEVLNIIGQEVSIR